ncbi:MAG: NADH-quinone oxidoreductase subunit C [Planctomycetota bacterium]
MTAQEIFEKLKETMGKDSVEFVDDRLSPFIKVKPDFIQKTALYLFENPDLFFNSLMNLTCVDYPDTFTIVYHLFSMKHLHKITLKVTVDKTNPFVLTVENIWNAANWFEREVYDLFGVRFDGHSNMIRILLPDDWEGHPLRKDYQYPQTYRGIPL